MKKLYMLMIIIFSIMFLPLVANATPFNRATYVAIECTDGTEIDITSQVSFSGNDISINKQNVCSGNARPKIVSVVVGVPQDMVGKSIYVNGYISGQFYPNIHTAGNTAFCELSYNGSVPDYWQGNTMSCQNFVVPNARFIISFNTAQYHTYVQTNDHTLYYESWPNSINLTIRGLSYFTSVEEYIKYISENTNDVNNSINSQIQQDEQHHQDIINDDTSGNASSFESDINNFSVPNDSHAFDILGSLQSFIGNIQVSGACSRLSVPIPFTNQTFILPCMTTDVYSVHFREIVIIWQIICRGVGYYYILVNVLKLVKETLDPFNFKLEVLDL